MSAVEREDGWTLHPNDLYECDHCGLTTHAPHPHNCDPADEPNSDAAMLKEAMEVDWAGRLEYCERRISAGEHTRAELYCKEAIETLLAKWNAEVRTK